MFSFILETSIRDSKRKATIFFLKHYMVFIHGLPADQPGRLSLGGEKRPVETGSTRDYKISVPFLFLFFVFSPACETVVTRGGW